MKGLFKGRNMAVNVLLSMLLAYLAVICLINFCPAPGFFDADMYSDYLYAMETWEHRSIFPEGWIFGNQLNAVSTPVLAALFYGITGSPGFAMASACTIMAVLVMVCFDWMVKPALQQLESRLLAAVLLITVVLYYGNAVTGNMGWSLLFTMCSYYAGYSITAFLAFGCYLRSRTKNGFNQWGILLLTCLLSFGTGIQSIRQTAVMVVPMMAAEMLRLLCSFRKWKKDTVPARVAAVVAVSNILGLAAVRMIPIDQYQIFGVIRLTEPSAFVKACIDCFRLILTFLSNSNPESHLVLALLFVVCLAALIPFLKKENHQEHVNQFMLILLIGMSVLVIIGIDIVTTMYVRPRYYFMLYPLIGFLAACFFDRQRLWGQRILLVGITAFFCLACIRELPEVCLQSLHRQQDESYQISDYLQENGYSTAYAVWGHGSDIAVASGGAVKLGFWYEAEEPFVKMRYLCDRDVYGASAERCVYLFDGAQAAAAGELAAREQNVELVLLQYFPQSDTYVYTAPVNLMRPAG